MQKLISQVGTIGPPPTIPIAGADPSDFVASLVSAGISLLLIVSFVIALIWMIFAGLSFIFAGDDPKAISSSWSRIYWGLIGMAVVLGAFAIIKLAETFFDVSILTNFQLPQR